MPKTPTIDPTTGITPAQLRAKLRSALREIWRATSRKTFLVGARVPHEGAGRGKYDVICATCDKRIGFSQKEYRVNKDGTKSKKPRLAYEVDHVDGTHPFTKLEDLGVYAESLMYGALRVLCHECHTERTKKQRQSTSY